MRSLLMIASALEAVTGAALVADPVLVTRLLLGSDLAGVGVGLGRVTGFGLVALGVACRPEADAASGRARALPALLTYNLLVAVYLAVLGAGGEWVGPLLWPVVAVHTALTLLLARAWMNSAV